MWNWFAVWVIGVLLLAYVWAGTKRQGQFTPNHLLIVIAGVLLYLTGCVGFVVSIP